jgi:hypothetical protein
MDVASSFETTCVHHHDYTVLITEKATKYSMKVSVFWHVTLCNVVNSCDGSKKGRKVQTDPEDEGTVSSYSW